MRCSARWSLVVPGKPRIRFSLEAELEEDGSCPAGRIPARPLASGAAVQDVLQGVDDADQLRAADRSGVGRFLKRCSKQVAAVTPAVGEAIIARRPTEFSVQVCRVARRKAAGFAASGRSALLLKKSPLREGDRPLPDCRFSRRFDNQSTWHEGMGRWKRTPEPLIFRCF